MANAVYPKYKEALLGGDSDIALDTGTVKVALVNEDYTYSDAHEFYDDVSTAVVGTPQEITSKSITGGVFDGADVTFSAVSGDVAKAIEIFIDTGNPATSRLVAYLDTGVTGLPVQPNGGDILISWNASGIVQL